MTGRLSGYTELHPLDYALPGRTVLAKHDATGERVMVRYFPDDLPAGAAGEMRLLSTLDSPYLVRIRELVWQEPVRAAVLEPVRAVSLRALLADQGVATPESALHLLRGSLCGLAAAHAAGVVHRGYGPDVVLIDAEGEIKLIDFGVVSGDPTPAAVAGGQDATATGDIRAAVAVFVSCLAADVVYPTEKVLLAAAPQALRGLVRAGLAEEVDAVALLASLDEVAVAEFGSDWATRGRLWLALRAAELRIEALRAEAALAWPPLDEPGSDGEDGSGGGTGRAGETTEGGAIAAALAAEELLLHRLRTEDARTRAGRVARLGAAGPAVAIAGEQVAAGREIEASAGAADTEPPADVRPQPAAEEIDAGAGAAAAVATVPGAEQIAAAAAGGGTDEAARIEVPAGGVGPQAGGVGPQAGGVGPGAEGAGARPGGRQPSRPPARPRRRLRRLPIAAAALLFVVVAGLVAFWLSGRQEPAGAGPAVPAVGPGSTTPGTAPAAVSPSPTWSPAPAYSYIPGQGLG
ncbi:MAG: hypothetical protein J2P15_09120 [Micromonosporaceae bacterium]|nr:hypothetical protein [Micromonosporaceae bacterium]